MFSGCLGRVCDNALFSNNFPSPAAKVEVSDEKLEDLMETGNFGSIFNGDVSTEGRY